VSRFETKAQVPLVGHSEDSDEDLQPFSIFDEVDDDYRLTIYRVRNENTGTKPIIEAYSTYKTKVSASQAELLIEDAMMLE
jgi:hypothetical protein